MTSPNSGARRIRRRAFVQLGLTGAAGLALAACSANAAGTTPTSEGAPKSSAPGGSASSTPGAVPTSSAPTGSSEAGGGDIVYEGGTFDAKGATLRLALWGGPFEQYSRQFMMNQFEKDFNCKISQDTAFPWTPKFIANGIDNPPYDLANWNLPDLAQAASGHDFFVPVDEVKRNLPEAKNLWPFAFQNGFGVTWVYTQYGYAYRKDKVAAPTSFKDFWTSKYSGNRATYTTDNTLEMVFFLLSNIVWGSGVKDFAAGYKAMKSAMPMKVSHFTANMQSLLSSGEVTLAVLDDGDAYNTIAAGAPLGFYYWTDKKPVLTQTFTVSKHSKPLQQKLAYALANRFCEASFLNPFNKKMFQRPSNRTAELPDIFTKMGVKNTEDQTKDFWIPQWSWFVTQEADWSRTVNSIFGQ